MGYAGTPGMVWGWLIAMIFIQCVSMSMAEICSSMPTSGGLYYAAAALAPKFVFGSEDLWFCTDTQQRIWPFVFHLDISMALLIFSAALASWLTGWSNWCGQVTAAPSIDYAMAAMILAANSIQNPNFVPQPYQVFLLTTLIMLIHGCISSMPTKWIANFNAWGSSFNFIGLLIVIILIPGATKRTDQGLPRFTPSSSVWNDFYAGTDFSNGVALLMSFVAVIWTMRFEFHLTRLNTYAKLSP